MHFKDHYNCEETQRAWIEMKKAEYWTTGESMEYGHTKDGEPYVRMVKMGQEGKSMWYPLYQAAKKWNKAYDTAFRNWKILVEHAKTRDPDGEAGPRERDSDGILQYPHEDDVPRELESADEDEEELFDWEKDRDGLDAYETDLWD